jgi:predicted DNA-binding transcriptional regulator AlpA
MLMYLDMDNNKKRLIDMTQDELSQLLTMTISSLIGDLKKNDQMTNKKVNEELVPRLLVAQEFSVSAVTIDKWVKYTDFPKPIKAGRKLFFRRKDLQNFISKGKSNE